MLLLWEEENNSVLAVDSWTLAMAEVVFHRSFWLNFIMDFLGTDPATYFIS